HQRTSYPVPDSTGLAGCSAAIDIYKNVELAERVRQAKRLADDHLQSLIGKICLECSAIDDDVAVAGSKVNTCGRGLSAARSVILNVCHKSMLDLGSLDLDRLRFLSRVTVVAVGVHF